MQAYRIRRGANERSVADADALLTLAAAGDIRASDEIQTPDGWVPASSLPILKGRLGAEDPWAAWSDVDSVDADSLYKRMVDEPADLPVEALAPVGGEPAPSEPVALDPVALDAVALEPEPLDDDALVPVAATGTPPSPLVLPVATAARNAPLPLPPVARPERRPPPLPDELGEVIDFPPRARPLPPEALVRPRSTRSGPPPLVRTSRLVAMVVAGLLAVGLGYAWIRVNGLSRAGVSPSPVRSGPAAPAAPSPLVLLDAELRSTLAATPRDVREPGDLSDALLVELMQQRLDVVAAEGLVTKWVGKKGDEPRAAEVRIRYRSGGDMSRELGAIALVVGRYKRLYRLEVPVFEVIEETSGGVTRIDADQAEAYYQARLPLEDFLASIANKR